MKQSFWSGIWNRSILAVMAFATCVMLSGQVLGDSKEDAEKAAESAKEAAEKAAEAAKEAESKGSEAAKEAAAKAAEAAKEAASKAAEAAKEAAKEAAAKAAEAAKESESKSSEAKKESESGKSGSSGNPSNGNNGNSKDVGNASKSTSSDVQSSVRPFGLEIANKVQIGGSDDASERFQKNTLPDISKLVNEKLSERQNIDDSKMLLDPSKLRLKTDADVRVYFVGEGAGYANSLGFTTDGSASVKSSTASLIFPNASSSVSTLSPGQTVKRTDSEPLAPGDFVDVGRIKGGSTLDFFLIANGANGGKQIFTTQTSMNPDGINHVVSFAYTSKDSPYLILGFEDLMGGGDRDFNDLLFAVDVGAINMAELTAAPEPATVFTMSAFLGLGYMLVRRSKSKEQGK